MIECSCSCSCFAASLGVIFEESLHRMVSLINMSKSQFSHISILFVNSRCASVLFLMCGSFCNINIWKTTVCSECSFRSATSFTSCDKRSTNLLPTAPHGRSYRRGRNLTAFSHLLNQMSNHSLPGSFLILSLYTASSSASISKAGMAGESAESISNSCAGGQ